MANAQKPVIVTGGSQAIGAGFMKVPAEVDRVTGKVPHVDGSAHEGKS
jgi:hypothetical protein